MLSPLDDLPIHQVPEPVRMVGTSDRNFYDRYYFNAYAPEHGIFLIAGMGQYPNLGTIDAFVAVRRGDTQHVVRASRELGADRSDTTVGPFTVEVLVGLKRLRFACADDAGERDVELDLTFTGSVPAILEPRHYYRNHARVASDTMRLAQLGTWTGRLRLGAEELEVEPAGWTGCRDRSWGVRPVGEPEPRGIRDALPPPGFFWIWVTVRFDDFAIILIVHEDRAGHRVLEEAVQIFPEETGRDPVHLGSPGHEIEFVGDTRYPARARLTFTHPGGAPGHLDVEPLLAAHTTLGCGYGNDPEWIHGMYHGPGPVVQSRTFDLTDPDVQRRGRGVTDHAARFTLDDGRVAYGLFEFTILGPYDRYGFGRRSKPAG